MVVLSVELTKEDFYQFNYYTSWTAPWNSRKRFLYYCRNTLSAGVGGLLAIYLLEIKISLGAILVAGVFLLLFNFIAIPAWVKRFYRKHVEKFSSSPSNSNFFLNTELVIDEKGIQTKDDVSATLHCWPAFVRKSETEGYFYLYLSAQMALVIPKRIFGSEKEKAEFEKMLLTYFPLLSDLQSLNKGAN